MQQTNEVRREYRMRAWQRGFYIVLGIFLAGVGIIGAVAVAGSGDSSPLLLATLLPIGLSAYIIALAVRARFVVDDQSFSVRGIFREQTAAFSDIEGYRTVSTRNGTFWRLQLKQGGGSITVQKWFDCDDFLQRLVDLDQRDSNALLEEIKQSQELGASPEERLSALSRARTVNIALTVILIACAVGLFVVHNSYRLLLAAGLAVGPFAVLYLLNRDPLLYALGKPKKDPRTEMIIAFLASSMGLFFAGIGTSFVAVSSLFVWMALVLILLCGAFFSLAQKGSRPQGTLMIVLLFGVMYAYGLIAMADTQLDKGKPTLYETQVVGKHVTTGKSTSYYLDVAPWGPGGIDKPLRVPGIRYENTAIGDTVCLVLHPGALHSAWYEHIDCEALVILPHQ